MRVLLLVVAVFWAACQCFAGEAAVLPGKPLNTDDRIVAYRKLVTTKPEDLHYQNLLAGAYIQKMRETTDFGYIERAEKLVAQVLQVEARNYEALRLRSEIGLERHHFAEVAVFSREMIELAPDDAWNWGTLGDALMERGEYDSAADAYQKMVSLRPNQSSYNRASYYRWVMGDAEGAIAILRQAIDAGSPAPENTAWCLADLGNLYFKTGKLEEAAAAFYQGLRTFPGYHTAYAGLGRTQAAQGKLADAIESFRRAQAVVPMPEYTAALADLDARTGRKQEAQKQLALLDVVDRMMAANQEKTNRNLAMVFADQGRKLDRALELAQAELDVRGDVYTYDALGWALYRNGRYVDAEQAAVKALRFGTPEPAFHYHAGMIASALGKKDEAERHLERALALNARFDLSQAERAEAELRAVRHP